MKPRRDLLALSARFLALGLALLFPIFSTGCGYAPHRNPDLVIVANKDEATRGALGRAVADGGYILNAVGSSMLPNIIEGDMVVVVHAPFNGDLLGWPVVYRAAWADGRLVSHRLVAGDARSGFIASGDNNQHSETWEPIRSQNYVGKIVAIYRVQP